MVLLQSCLEPIHIHSSLDFHHNLERSRSPANHYTPRSAEATDLVYKILDVALCGQGWPMVGSGTLVVVSDIGPGLLMKPAVLWAVSAYALVLLSVVDIPLVVFEYIHALHLTANNPAAGSGHALEEMEVDAGILSAGSENDLAQP